MAPPEVAGGFSPRAQELVGYQAHVSADGGFLGSIDNRSPVDLLRDGELLRSAQ